MDVTRIVLTGLAGLGLALVAVAAWFAISRLGWLLASIFQDLPYRVQDCLTVIAAALALAGVVVLFGVYYHLGRLHHGVAFAAGFSAFTTAFTVAMTWVFGTLVGVLFTWVEDF